MEVKIFGISFLKSWFEKGSMMPTNVSRGAAMFLASAVDFIGSLLDIECCPDLARTSPVRSLHQHQRCHKPTAHANFKRRAFPILCRRATH